MTQLGIDQAMQDGVVSAIETLSAYLAEGGDISDFSSSSKRRRRAVPSVGEGPTIGVRFDPERKQRTSTTPEPAALAEETQPTVIEG